MQLCTYYWLIMLLTVAVSTTVILYRGELFGTDEGVVLVETYTAAIIFGITAIGSKLLSNDYPIGPRRFTFVQSRGMLRRGISYGGIIIITALFGFLLYSTNTFNPIEYEYSDLLYYCSHALVGLITATIITMSWIISSKL